MPPTGSTPEGEYNQEVQLLMLYEKDFCNNYENELEALMTTYGELRQFGKTTPAVGTVGAWLNKLYNAVMRYNWIHAGAETRMRRNGYSVAFDLLLGNDEQDKEGNQLPAREMLTVSIPDIRIDGWLDRVDASYYRHTDKGYTLVRKFHGKYLDLEHTKTLKEFFRFG